LWQCQKGVPKKILSVLFSPFLPDHDKILLERRRALLGKMIEEEAKSDLTTLAHNVLLFVAS